MTLAGLARCARDLATNEVAMAVGWLAREGRLRFREAGPICEIALRHEQRGGGAPAAGP